MTTRLDRWLLGLAGVLSAGLAATAWVMVQQIEVLDRRVESLEAQPRAAQPPAAPATRDPAGGDGRGEALAGLAGQVDRIAAKMDALDRSLVALRGELGRAAPAAGAAQDSREDPVPADPAPRLNTWEEADKRYWEEPVDPAWQRAMQQRITQAVSGFPGAERVQLDAVECRSERCLVSWRFDEGLSGEDYFELENYFIASLAQVGLNAATVRTEGTVQEAYFFYHPDQPPPAGGDDN